ncbi:MAG: ATP-dependent endonuclease [Candidatus Berkiella sp.]
MKIRHIDIKNFRGIKSFSAKIDGDLVCLIGHGDSCKSTIITAIDYALSPRWNINIDDSDFFNQDINNAISISVTLSDWDQENDELNKFFSESKFGQYIGGLEQDGVISEPIHGAKLSITINLSVDKFLEPKWLVVKGEDNRSITASDRSLFGVGRIDAHLDTNFTWKRNSVLSRISSENKESIDLVLSDIARSLRDNSPDLEDCNSITEIIKPELDRFGVKIDNLIPKIDIQNLSIASGALALHSGNVPLRNFGTGSKKLVSCALQMKLHNGRNITLIDEIELGLEPHRIRGLLNNLKRAGQQVITTTHSPVVLRELDVSNNELYVCIRNTDGIVQLKSLGCVPESQGPIRSNPEAFLGRKIIVCEGATEIGCLRALDNVMFNAGDIPVWSMNTVYFNAAGIGNVKTAALALSSLGYKVATLCDNDTPKQFNNDNIKELIDAGIQVFSWAEGNSIEQQLFLDLEWADLSETLTTIAKVHDSKTKESLIQSINCLLSVSGDSNTWIESMQLRQAIGLAAAGKNANGDSKDNSHWFKRIDYSENLFNFVIPKLSNDTLLKSKLMDLWRWVQND